MAQKKITELGALAKADVGDYYPIVDSSANTTKRVPAEHSMPDGTVTAAKMADGTITAAKVDAAAYLSGTFTNSTIISAPGEFTWTTVTTYDVTSLPTGAKFFVTVTSNAGEATNRNTGVDISYNSVGYSAVQYGQYYITASRSKLLFKVSGQNTVTIRYIGTANCNVGNFTADLMRLP
ncbi:hypothetical protein [Mycolicibacterium neoaurum]|uniref:hypothetical protein n=1 Tax=Mycolicibacterium neoaurum TaxID=1795 RepID=UPI001F4CE544|nr:hypothetical protein [Mycolicibacterium neoaurum]